MNYVLLSGGSGKRLWPLSNAVRSKQFIKIIKKEDGGYESMLQRTYNQIRMMDQDAKITIATAKPQVSLIRNQLGNDVNISIEPCRRDTFPAIVLAVTYLHHVKGVSGDETILVCPIDSYVELDYFLALKELKKHIEKGENNLMIMGIVPTYPSEKYGYIIPETNGKVSKVRVFKEKPNKNIANQYIEQGALWNSGVFAFKVKYILEKAHQVIDFTDYADLYTKYKTLMKISFDYAVLENEKNIQVMRFDGIWRDIGSWDTLTDIMEENCIGSMVIAQELLSVKLDAPVLCRLDAPELDFACCASADCLHQHLQVI